MVDTKLCVSKRPRPVTRVTDHHLITSMSFSRGDEQRGTSSPRLRVAQGAAQDSLQRNTPSLRSRIEVDMYERTFDTGLKGYRPQHVELETGTAQRATSRADERPGVADAARPMFAGVGEARRG